MNLLVLYFVVSWMPALLKSYSFGDSAGILAITLFGVGGIAGSLSQGWFTRRYPPHRVLAVEFSIFLLCTLVLASLRLDMKIIAATALTIGWTIQGAQAGLNVYSSTIYPTWARATGIGWGLGVGRIGSIVGPYLGGWALLAGWSSRQIFAAGAVPGVVAGIAILISAGLGITQMSDAMCVAPSERELVPEEPK
jgi:AAHS family 4-hydroxybenzoate transporter-like MFS transporter